MSTRKEYSNEEVTVVWKPDLCIHSEKCWRGLPNVFRPKEKPWINVENVNAEELKKQIDQCPSGALSYLNDNKEIKTDKNMSEVKAQVLENGPLMVTGACEITHKDGSVEVKDKAFFCRCGESANKPYCDGAHKKADFKG